MPSPVNRPVFRSVSADAPSRVVRLAAALAHRWWSAHCLVCREAVETAGIDLCAACRQSLPWQRHACPRCALPLGAPAPVCGTCLRRPPPVTETRAVFRYEAPLDRLLPRLKFHDDLAAGRLCAGLMADVLAAVPRPDVLVPLPLHRARLRSRGFDQTLELARPLARALALPLRDDLLVRARATAPQSRLDAAARRRNLRGAFMVRSDRPLPAHVALVDDVMTTGATLHAAADALLRAGVARVDAWVCARVA
jgi:ComF family protein